MLKVSRRCIREKLLETRRALTPYAATPVVVIGPRTKRRLGAFVSLTELVQHQVALAQQAGMLTVPPGWCPIPVIIVWMHARCGERLPLGRTYSFGYGPVSPALQACQRIGPHGG